MKRLIDILGSIAALIIFAPLMMIIALLVYLTDPGSVIFKQKRLGLGGREFTMYKFRSMVQNAEEILKKDSKLYEMYIKCSFTLEAEKDPRITRVGRLIRKTSIDELPQLFNVLKGEMSLVGPRPIVKEELGHYGSQSEDFLSVKPGMTGYWQVSGRDEIAYPERVGVELYYVRNQTLWFDFIIMLKTVMCVILCKNIYTPYKKEAQTQNGNSMRLKYALGVLSILGIMAAIFLFFLWRLQPQQHFSNNIPILASSDMQAEEEDPGLPNFKLQNFTILLLGIDAREQEASRTDTIMLAQVDLINGKVGLMSIPRDTRVFIEGIGYTKINHAHFIGEMKDGTQAGTQETIRAVSNLCQCDINYYIKIDFKGFREFVDALGGIELELPKPVKLTYSDITLPAGKQKLDGRTVLNLVRERESLADGDFGRQKNQALVIKSLADKAVELQNLKRLPTLVSQLLKEVIDMNLSDEDLISLALLMKNISSEDVNYTQIPGKAGYAIDPLTKTKLYYWIPNYSPEQKTDRIGENKPD